MKLLHGFTTAMAEVRTQVVPQRSLADELFVNGLKHGTRPAGEHHLC
jgi:hypothetical protein